MTTSHVLQRTIQHVEYALQLQGLQNLWSGSPCGELLQVEELQPGCRRATGLSELLTPELQASE